MGTNTFTVLVPRLTFSISLTNHDQPFGFLDSIRIGLGISKTFDFDALSILDLVLGTMSNKHRLSSPFDDDL